MQYRFEMTYGEPEFTGYMAAYMRRNSNTKKFANASRIITRVAGGMMVGISIANIISAIFISSKSGQSVPFYYWLVPILVLILGFVVFFSKDIKVSGKVLWKNYADKGSRVTFVFGPDDFKEHGRSKDERYGYDSIIDIYEDPQHFYLFTAPTSAHIIMKSGAVKGIEGFRQFIEEKTGRQTRSI